MRSRVGTLTKIGNSNYYYLQIRNSNTQEVMSPHLQVERLSETFYEFLRPYEHAQTVHRHVPSRQTRCVPDRCSGRLVHPCAIQWIGDPPLAQAQNLGPGTVTNL